ncbi:aspartate aminotransferase family protein [Agrobacterium larrymoorei]|uniref:aspartate aminotransferase family protein n=1 Tax=Agrobacterium larrymoorei TaxID=160699 RepID=UPI001574C4A5|nr:aspartate aminotransferase family protein [Agrobacterium larrymoorei]NTJ43851.1 aspartate aminotransferase family protein [Agrobacterium larrymoorei]
MTVISNSLAAADIASVMHPNTNLRQHERTGPLVMERGDGIRVYDDRGKEYIEGLAGLWSVAVGFSEPRLAEAAYKQMLKLPYYHTFSSKSHEPSIRLAEKLVEMTPANITRAFFTSSGSEANDTIVKMVWYMNNALGRPQKKKFLSRIKGYHGITIASGSLTGLPINHRDFDLPAIPVHHLTCPHFYRFGVEGEDEAAFTARLLAELAAVIEKEGADTIAAFIGEPLMSAGGVLPPPAGYWEGVERICRANDILIVSDEVICGFGRLGTPVGCQKYRFTPDIMTLSKQITSSYMPFAAVMFSDAIYQAIADNSEKIGAFGHGFTASGHPVASAVALENIAIIEERDLIGNAARLEAQFHAGLQSFTDHPLVGEARGAGLIGAVELVADKAKRRPFEKIGKAGALASVIGHEEGLIFRAIGDQLALCPPLIVTSDDVDEIMVRMRRTLSRLPAAVAAEGLV